MTNPSQRDTPPPLPPEFIAIFPDAPNRQTTPITDWQDALSFHRTATPQWQNTVGGAPNSAGRSFAAPIPPPSSAFKR